MARTTDRLRGFELDERRHRVFVAWCKGQPVHELAQAEGVHHSQIVRDLDAKIAELKTADATEEQAARCAMIGRIATAEAEAWAAWERSKRPRERRTARHTKRAATKAEKGQKAAAAAGIETGEIRTEERDGDARFLATLARLWELRAKLCGLIISRHEHVGPGGGPIPHTLQPTVEVTDQERDGILKAALGHLGWGPLTEPAAAGAEPEPAVDQARAKPALAPGPIPFLTPDR